MNKINIISLTLMVSMLFVSCEDSFLDRFPTDEVSPENSFKTAKDLELYTNGFYEWLPTANDIVRADNTSDNILYGSVPMEQRTTDRLIEPEAGKGGWSWSFLRKVNMYFDNYHKCEDQDAADYYKGVASFFRGWFYFNKVKTFGDVPWYDTVITTSDIDLLYKARDPREMIVDNVITDLKFAVSVLGTEKASDKVTKWTALALLSRVCLYEGTYRKYHDMGDSDVFLEQAYKAAEEVMTSGYTLYSTGSIAVDYRDLFASNDLKTEEVILGRVYSQELDKLHYTNYYLLSKTQMDVSLTKDLVNTYLNSNGTAFTEKVGYKTMEFKEEMAARDLRLAQTIRSIGYTRIGESTVLLPDFEAAMSGYQICKFLSTRDQDTEGTSQQDIAIIRYPEVLLNYAEAKAELGILTQDDIDKSIKLIRERVGMPNLNMSKANANPDAVLAATYPNVAGANQGIILEIRRERRVELAVEGFRYDDLMRWKAGARLGIHFEGMYFPSLGDIDLDGDGAVDVHLYTGSQGATKAPQSIQIGSIIKLTNDDKSGNLVAFKNITKGWNEDRDYLYPIPTGDILLNDNLVQNPNWN